MPPTADDIRIAACVTVPMSLLATYFRLYLRTRKGLLWWDDFWAFMSSVGMIVCFSGLIMFTDAPTAHPVPVKIAAYYMIDNGFYAVIWFARVSLMLTVVRIAYGRIKLILKYLIVAFFITYLILEGQLFMTCENEAAWKKAATPQCELGQQVAIAQLVTDVLADLILIIAPTFLLTKMKGRRGLKIRLIAVFSSTILTTITSLLHAYAIIKIQGLIEVTLAVVEVVTSLTVVNLTVIATWALRLKDDGEDEGGQFYVNTFLRGRLSGRKNGNTGTGTVTATGTNLFALKTFTGTGIEITVDTTRADDLQSEKPDAHRGDDHTADNALDKDKQTITWMADQ